MLEEENTKIKNFYSRINIYLIFFIIVSSFFIIALLKFYINQTYLIRYEQYHVVALDLMFLKPIIDDTYLQLAINYGNLYPLYNGLAYILHNIIGLNSYQILLFPFSYILLPISIFLFVKEFFKEINYKTLFGASFIFIYYLNSMTLQIGSKASLAMPLVFFFSLLLIKILKKEKVKKYSILAFLVLFFLIGTWHTASQISTIFLGSLCTIYLITSLIFRNLKKREKIQFSYTFYPKISIIGIAIALIAAVILFFTKKDLIIHYINSLQDTFFSNGNFFNNIISFFDPIIRRLTGRGNPTAIEDYSYNYSETIWGKIALYSHVFIGLIGIFSLLIGLILFIIKTKRSKMFNSNYFFIIIISFTIVLCAVLNYIAYSGTGVGTFYIMIVFPIIGFFISKKINLRKVTSISLIVLSLLSFTRSSTSMFTNNFNQGPITLYEDNIYAFNWFYENIPNGSNVILDFNFYPRLLHHKVINNINISYNLHHLSSTSNQFLIGETDRNIMGNWIEVFNTTHTYFLLDYKTISSGYPIHTRESRSLIKCNLTLINKNENLYFIYLDSFVSVYKINPLVFFNESK